MKTKIYIMLSILLAASAFSAGAATREEKKEFHVNFRINKYDIDPSRGDNREQLARMDSLLWAVEAGDIKMDSIVIEGWASPEGPVLFNQDLSKRRRQAMRTYLEKNHPTLTDRVVDGTADIAWQPLIEAIEACDEPWRDEVLAILYDAPAPGKADTRNARLKRLRGGSLWPTLIKNYYAPLRNSASAVFTIYVEDEPVAPLPEIEPEEPEEALVEIEPEEPVVPAEEPTIDKHSPLYMALTSNMLYDVAAVPNVGFDIYLGRNWSIAGDWQYAWWHSRPKARYWRTYGGYLGARYWFGSKAQEKPLQGHHIGAYMQAMLYDFEWGGKGYLSGVPGKSIFHHPTWGGGIEYGYSLPIAKRLNIDFNIGVGYLTGQYYIYDPADGHFVWRETKNRRYFGPTKVEVSIVWLLGRGNSNIKKGGDL